MVMNTAFTPKVSIVIPVYNGSNYLKEAIDSALAQTYKNIEILVVNDGSNDNGATERIALSYGDKIRYFKKENGGVATALNFGIKKMTGEYFSWLSHDDMYYRDKIEKQINYLATLKSKKVLLYSNYSVLQGKQIIPVVFNHELLLRKPKYSLLRGSVNGITILVPKSIMDEVGKFDEQLRSTQDYDYWRRIEAKYEFIHMEEVLSITRLHPGQDTNISPRVVTEGDALWIDMVMKLPNKEKLQYEGTMYNFYFEMVKFLGTTPYKGALEYCQNELRRVADEVGSSSFNPKVSIVVPFYNRVDKTITSLKSALGQTHNNTEIILINDGSTDDISKLIEFIKGYKNIRFTSLKYNQGPSVARNRGIDQATGDYIAFLDSDDEFVDSKIEYQLAEMRKFNLNLSYTSYLKREENKNDTVMCDRQLTGFVVPKIVGGVSIATPTVIVSRAFLNNNGLRFNEALRKAEDSCFWLECAKHTEILLVDRPLTIVNLDKDSHVNNSLKLVEGMKIVLAYLLNDKYYSKFNDEISLQCEYFLSLNADFNEEELDRILVRGPVKSVAPGLGEKIPKLIRAQVRGSIFYRAARKIYARAKSIHSRPGRVRRS